MEVSVKVVDWKKNRAKFEKWFAVHASDIRRKNKNRQKVCINKSKVLFLRHQHLNRNCFPITGHILWNKHYYFAEY